MIRYWWNWNVNITMQYHAVFYGIYSYGPRLMLVCLYFCLTRTEHTPWTHPFQKLITSALSAMFSISVLVLNLTPRLRVQENYIAFKLTFLLFVLVLKYDIVGTYYISFRFHYTHTNTRSRAYRSNVGSDDGTTAVFF